MFGNTVNPVAQIAWCGGPTACKDWYAFVGPWEFRLTTNEYASMKASKQLRRRELIACMPNRQLALLSHPRPAELAFTL